MMNINKNFFPRAKIVSGGGLFKLNKPRYYQAITLNNTFTSGGKYEI